MLSLAGNNQAGVIEAFNSASRYLDDLFNNDNHSCCNRFIYLFTL